MRELRSCSCLGFCKGRDGLSDRYLCAVEQKPGKVSSPARAEAPSPAQAQPDPNWKRIADSLAYALTEAVRIIDGVPVQQFGSTSEAWVQSAENLLKDYDAARATPARADRDEARMMARMAGVRADNAERRESALLDTLRGIANADPRAWDEGLNTDAEFRRWAQSRASSAIIAADGDESEN